MARTRGRGTAAADEPGPRRPGRRHPRRPDRHAPEDAVPLPPGWTPPKPARDRAALSREAILQAALRLVDTEGMEAVSMRRVAQELGTGAASLYAHIANKDELMQLLVDRVMAEIDVPEPDPERWQEQLKELLYSSWQTLVRHGDLAVASMGDIPLGPNAVRLTEGFLALMRAGGVPDRAAAWAVDRLSLYVQADAFEGTLFLRKARGAGEEPETFMADYLDHVHRYFDGLPADRFPNIRRVVPLIMDSGGPDGRFEFGLDLLVQGLARLAAEAAEERAEQGI